MFLVCELHVHTDCIQFACSDCRQCHQDGHQDHVSVDASAGESGPSFSVWKHGLEEGEESWSFLSHGANFQSTFVAYWQAKEMCGFRKYGR